MRTTDIDAITDEMPIRVQPLFLLPRKFQWVYITVMTTSENPQGSGTEKWRRLRTSNWQRQLDRIRKTACCLLGLLVTATFAWAAPRTWTLKQGGKVEGEYMSSGTTTVVLKKEGTNLFLRISDLSTNDQTYIAELQAAQQKARLDATTAKQMARFDAEAKQMEKDGLIEFTTKLIEGFPEKVDYKRGWMDAEFRETDSEWVAFPTLELGFVVDDKEGNIFFGCKVDKRDGVETVGNTTVTYVKLDDAVMKLHRGDKVRLIGTIRFYYTKRASFVVDKIEMIKPALKSEPPQ